MPDIKPTSSKVDQQTNQCSRERTNIKLVKDAFFERSSQNRTLIKKYNENKLLINCSVLVAYIVNLVFWTLKVASVKEDDTLLNSQKRERQKDLIFILLCTQALLTIGSLATLFYKSPTIKSKKQKEWLELTRIDLEEKTEKASVVSQYLDAAEKELLHTESISLEDMNTLLNKYCKQIQKRDDELYQQIISLNRK
jgi:hypothetical protein